MASTPEQTQASPTSESRVSVEQEVQHEASDGEPDMPPSKKPRKRKSRLLSGLNPSNILASPQSQAVANDEDDDASTSRTQSERRGKERPQREARLSNTRDQYDMKYHPLDEQIRPAYAAKRRSLTTLSPSVASSSTADDDAAASDAESLPSSARVSDTEPSFHGRLHSSELDLEIIAPTQRHPDPKATRRSSREEARKHHDYSAKHHPQDYGIPGHQHKARKADRVAFASTQAATQTGRKRKRDSYEMSGALQTEEEESQPPLKRGSKKPGRGKGKAAVLSSGEVDDLVESTLRNIGELGGAAGTPIVISDGVQASDEEDEGQNVNDDQFDDQEQAAAAEEEEEDEEEELDEEAAAFNTDFDLTQVEDALSTAAAAIAQLGHDPDVSVEDDPHDLSPNDNDDVEDHTAGMPETQNTTASSRTMVPDSEEESVHLDEEEAPPSEFADQLAVTETRDTGSDDAHASDTATEEAPSDAHWDPTPPGSHPSQQAPHVDQVDSPLEQNNPQYPSPATSLDVPAGSHGFIDTVMGLFGASTGFQAVNAPH